jgi:hypothetical protein
MTNQHPITPPPELLQQWAAEYWNDPGELIGDGEKYIATLAAQWGADQELEAILKLAGEPSLPEWDRCFDGFTVASLREERRPKPTLKEQALRELGDAYDKGKIDDTTFNNIKLALEALPDA